MSNVDEEYLETVRAGVHYAKETGISYAHIANLAGLKSSGRELVRRLHAQGKATQNTLVRVERALQKLHVYENMNAGIEMPARSKDDILAVVTLLKSVVDFVEDPTHSDEIKRAHLAATIGTIYQILNG